MTDINDVNNWYKCKKNSSLKIDFENRLWKYNLYYVSIM